MPPVTTATDAAADAPAGRLWQGLTPDAREADRRHRLVEAGLELMGTHGVAALTMRAACREASVGPRYFYDLFATREELLEAVYDETVDRVREPILEAVAAAVQGDDLVGAIRTGFDTAVAVVEEDPRLGRILFRESAADNTLRPRSQAAMPEFVLTVIEQVLPERAQELRGAGGWTLIGFSAAIFSLFLAWSEGARHTSRDEFVAHCSALAVDTLGLEVD
ncbi:MAG: TetR/AcrR family transcriptional regulator [Propionibacteriales bacterium]|nr:TetR/AcrR family transcriptional regulator [Propionibacteriales bacterium]